MTERDTTRSALLREFANTFTEWHYLVGGACIGFVLGWLLGARASREQHAVHHQGDAK